MADNNQEITIIDPTTGIAYPILLGKEDFERAEVDFEFCSALLEGAKKEADQKKNREFESITADLYDDNDLTEDLTQVEEEPAEEESQMTQSLLSPVLQCSTTLEEILISLVQIRPPLWDSRLPITERGRSIRDKLWLEIFNILKDGHNVSLEQVMRKWKGLKDTYIKVRGDVENYVPSGSGAGKKKKIWKHYESLKFLGDTMIPRITTSSLHKPSTSTYKAGVLTNPSPSVIQPTTNTPSSGVTPKGIKRKFAVEEQIKKTSDFSETELEQKISKGLDRVLNMDNEVPVCTKIAELLLKMPLKERSRAEIKLLQVAYDLSEPYL